MNCKECLDSLGPYVDGELSTDEAAQVKAHLATCVDCSAQYQRLVETRTRLKGALMRYEAPDVLKARIRASLTRPETEIATTPKRVPFYRLVSWPSAIAAAAVLAIFSSAVTLSVANNRSPRDTRQNELLASHIRSLMPGHLTDVASNDQHNVKPWFNGRVDMSPTVPRLDSLGFPLVGGRIDYIEGRTVPVIVYTRRQHVINVYSWPTNAGAEQRMVASSHGYNLIRLYRNGEELWFLSDLNRAELESFARLFVEKSG
ncbi:MAG TPA: anti-sigma factor [Gemmatimonadaceae bacterium]|nr:anti-sigma factor [Gemmatimonadaceae bacterium]